MSDILEGGAAGAGTADVAVVIPCYNTGPWVARAVRSAFAEGPPDVCVIVVDDGSSDDSAARAREAGASLVETGPNRGACHARNRGLALAEARGARRVLFLDADDYLEDAMLSGAVEAAEATGADMVLSNMHVEAADGRRTLRPLYAGRIAPETFFEGWMRRDYVNPSAILWRVEFVRRIGGWDESLSRAQDMEITLRALTHDPLIHKNERGCAIYSQVNAGSITADVSHRAIESRLRVVCGLIERIEGGPFERFRPLMHDELYSIARHAFIASHAELGRRAQQVLREQGHRGHHGTRAHRLLAGALGLEGKVRLWGS